MAAPSFRTQGRNTHGLMAVLHGVESNSELMDAIRQLMVALDHAVIELKQGETHLNSSVDCRIFVECCNDLFAEF